MDLNSIATGTYSGFHYLTGNHYFSKIHNEWYSMYERHTVENPKFYKDKLMERNYNIDLATLIKFDKENRELITKKESPTILKKRYLDNISLNKVLGV